MPSLSARKTLRRALAVAILSATSLSGYIEAQENKRVDSSSSSVVSSATSPERKQNAQPEIANRFEKAKVRFVHSTTAVVRCGPAEEYYATDKLDKGTQVDVYLETANGWSGIRPSNRSHNWIPSDAVYILPGGKSAEVIVDTTPAWVGSDVEKIENFLWQTELVKTQQVSIVGEAYQGTGENRKLWLRIAPPQGEFRWVRTNQLSDVAPRTTPIPTGIQPVEPTTSGLQQANTTSKNNDSSVQLAQYSEPLNTSEPPPKIVWSDENEQIAKIEAQIRREQNEIKSQMAEQGVHVAIDSPEILDAEPESLLSSEEGIVSESTSTRKSRSIKPIPRNAASRGKSVKRATPNGAHPTDAQHWNAMQTSNDPKLKVGPMSSILGMIGLSVVEADRIPQNAKIARQSNQQQFGGALTDNLGQIGALDGSRLDRLPRPARRVPGSNYSYSGLANNNSSAPTGSGVDNQFANAGSTFSKWLQSNEPVFGASNAPATSSSTLDSAVASASPLGSNQGWYGINSTTTAVHRDVPNGMTTASSAAFSQPSSNPSASWSSAVSDDDREFTTPEIQSALLELTEVVAQPTERWNFVDLHRRASQWIENGSDALVRGEARLLKERIERFESLRQKSLGIATSQSIVPSATMNANANLNPQSYPPSNGAMTGNAFNQPAATFPTTGNISTQPGDASGWLVQVHTSVPGQPEFALTDDAGNVIVYVQPTAGLNLRRYLQQPVSVQGVRGYLPTLAAKQILAERVVRIR